jgi:hypothetical protein
VPFAFEFLPFWPFISVNNEPLVSEIFIFFLLFAFRRTAPLTRPVSSVRKRIPARFLHALFDAKTLPIRVFPLIRIRRLREKSPDTIFLAMVMVSGGLLTQPWLFSHPIHILSLETSRKNVPKAEKWTTARQAAG